MKIVAIDPGPERSAFVCWDTNKHGFVETQPEYQKGIMENDELFLALHNIVGVVDGVCIEFPQSYGMSVGRSIFDTCRWCGKFETVADQSNTPTRRYGRPTIKGQIGGRTDAEIRASLRMRYGEAKKGEKLEGVKKDIWSALALAVALEERPNLKEW